jgi:hypothetical protein
MVNLIADCSVTKDIIGNCPLSEHLAHIAVEIGGAQASSGVAPVIFQHGRFESEPD